MRCGNATQYSSIIFHTEPVAALRVCKRWAEGDHRSTRLHGSSQYNTIIIGKLPLFINGAIINNISVLKNNGYTTKKKWFVVFRFFSKSQNAGNAISETLNSKLFWRRIPPEPSTYDITLWGPKFFSRTVPCPKRYSVNGAYKRHFILQRSENTRKDTYAENVVVNYLRNSVKTSLFLLYVVVS